MTGIAHLAEERARLGAGELGSTWFEELIWHVVTGEPIECRTGGGESCLLVLSGTHDLQAGGGSWIARGFPPGTLDCYDTQLSVRSTAFCQPA